MELTQQIDMLQRQLQDALAENDDHRVKRSRQQKDLVDWEAKVALLTTEIERLRTLLVRKDEEIEQWKQKYFKLEATLSELHILREKNRVLNSEIDRLNALISELETENAQLKLSLVNINEL